MTLFLSLLGVRNRASSTLAPKILSGPVRTLRGHGSSVLSVAVRSDLDLVASCSHSGCLLHSFATGQLTRRIQVRGANYDSCFNEGLAKYPYIGLTVFVMRLRCTSELQGLRFADLTFGIHYYIR